MHATTAFLRTQTNTQTRPPPLNINQVRDAAREVTVAVYQVIGPRVLRYVEPLLRRKQLDEYEEAFRRVAGPDGFGGGGGGEYPEGEEEEEAPATAAAGGAREKPWAVSPPAPAGPRGPKGGGGGRPGSAGSQARGAGGGQPRPAQQQQQQQQQQQRASPPRAAAGKAPMAGAQAPIDFEISDSFEEGEVEGRGGEMTCQFCGRFDPGFTEDALDHHYFVECPLLMRCSEW